MEKRSRYFGKTDELTSSSHLPTPLPQHPEASASASPANFAVQRSFSRKRRKSPSSSSSSSDVITANIMRDDIDYTDKHQSRKERNRKYVEKHRQNMTETESETLRENDKTRKALSRQNLDDDEAEIMREQARSRMSTLRQNLSDDEAELMREQARSRMSTFRQNLNDDEAEIIREQDRKRKTNTRQILNDDEAEIMREQDRKRKANTRQNLNVEEAELMRDRDRLRKATNRKEKKNNLPLYGKACERTNIEFFGLSPFEVECSHCNAIHFSEEKPPTSKGTDNEFFSCCNYGKYKNLENLIGEYPDELKELFSLNELNHKKFIENLRKYNNCFACASLGCNRFKFDTQGPPCFKISGQVYHNFNLSAQPIDEQTYPTNGQLYFLDNDEAINVRSQTFDDLDPVLLSKIEVTLRNYYPFAKAYEMMKDVITEQQQKFKQTGVKSEVKMLMSLRSGYDQNRYNISRANEVAAIVVCNASDEIPPANIVVVEKNTKKLTNIYPLDPIVEPLTYPLLYPFGTRGWEFSLKDTDGKRISLCDFIKFKLFYRKNLFLAHHYSRKLFQQWIVDQCTRVEWNRLNYIKTHQNELRAGNYKGLDDYLVHRAEQIGANVGKQIVLPSSFMGGPRNMDQNYMDALTIVGETGKPDLFITYTINPEDPDIKKCILPGQKTHDRPDIIARVFNLKANCLINEICKKGLFGKVIGYCWVDEFQKRGLPHRHILITLDSDDKFKNKEDIDKIINAELPDKVNEPFLRELVKKFMLHGPCGDCRKDAPCMRNGKCRFKYPKKFIEETKLGEDGYAIYKRPNNNEFEYNKGVRLTNQNVVPFNPYLLMRFRSHINVEVCSEINAAKYLYKYIYKGYDAATVECVQQGINGEQITLKYDEVQNYLEARYLSPVEACHRLFKYDLQGKSHAIERLEIHVENEQMVYFKQNSSNDTIGEAMQKDSKLMAYFKFFSENPNAPKHYKYIDMPKYCTFDEKLRKWKWPRKGHYNVIGRMYTVNPKNIELYYLRYLLLHVPASSFSDLKTVNNITYNSYAQACLARGLCRDDAEWDNCLAEASKFKFPSGLRSLFVNILINCDPKNPELLWTKYKDDLSEDLKNLYSNSDIAYENCLAIINQKLLAHDKSLDSFKDMPKLTGNTHYVKDEDIFNPKDEIELANNKYKVMNKDQKQIYDEFTKIIKNQKGSENCFYIDGPGGTGKSFVQSAIYHLARGHKKKVCNMAFSGIASTLLKKGRTVHNRFKLPLDLDANSTSSIEIQSKDATEIKETDVFIWDEAPMAPKYALDIVNKKLQEIHKNNKPFGGKIMICSGDKRQVLPIKRKANRSELVNLTISNSKLWKHFKVMHLKENMRSDPNAKNFAEQLLAIGNGTFGDGEYIRLPDQCYIEEDLTDEIFGDIIEKSEYSKLCSHCILAPYNREVDEYNEQVLAKFPGDYVNLYSIDEAESKTGLNVLPEFLHKLQNSSLPKHEIKLKINCVVMLIRNLNVSDGLCNGTRMQILDINKNILRVMILTGDRIGEIVFIPRITLIEDKSFPYLMRRHQYPIKLAFCMTINKGQAQTFEKIGIDFTRDVFAHGQTYVAISRGRSWEKLRVKIDKNNKDKKIKNIVWKEVL